MGLSFSQLVRQRAVLCKSCKLICYWSRRKFPIFPANSTIPPGYCGEKPCIKVILLQGNEALDFSSYNGTFRSLTPAK